MNELIQQMIETLEDREAILIKHVELDEKYFNDPLLGQFYRGRVAVENDWLEDVRKLLKTLKS